MIRVFWKSLSYPPPLFHFAVSIHLIRQPKSDIWRFRKAPGLFLRQPLYPKSICKECDCLERGFHHIHRSSETPVPLLPFFLVLLVPHSHSCNSCLIFWISFSLSVHLAIPASTSALSSSISFFKDLLELTEDINCLPILCDRSIIKSPPSE